MKLVYDESVTVSYPLFVCPKCGSEFYGGGKAMHERDCREGGYGNCEVHFGPRLIEKAKKSAEMFDPDHKWYGISLNMLVEGGFVDLEAEVVQ